MQKCPLWLSISRNTVVLYLTGNSFYRWKLESTLSVRPFKFKDSCTQSFYLYSSVALSHYGEWLREQRSCCSVGTSSRNNSSSPHHRNVHIENKKTNLHTNSRHFLNMCWFAFSLMDNKGDSTKQSSHNQVNPTSILTACPFLKKKKIEMKTIKHSIKAKQRVIPVIEFIWAALTINAKILNCIFPDNGGNLHSTKCNQR